MISPIAKDIKVNQLSFSDEVSRRFASLAMSVEISEHKRFSVSKSLDLVIELIGVASKSVNPQVKAALSSLAAALDTQQKSLLIGMGAEFVSDQVVIEAKPMDAIDKKYLNGARG